VKATQTGCRVGLVHPHRIRLRKRMRAFVDLAEKLKMGVTDLMRQFPRQALHQGLRQGLARELDVSTRSWLSL
jgi:hypothetical protein